MSRSWKQSIIVSHGGTHGEGRTLHKGRAVKPADTKLVPDALLGASTEATPEPATTPPAPPHPCDSPTTKAIKRALMEEHHEAELERVEAEAEAHEAEEGEGAPEEEQPPEPAEEEQPPPLDDTPEMPTTKRQLRLMRVADVERVAEYLGIVVGGDTKGRTDTLRELIAARLEL